MNDNDSDDESVDIAVQPPNRDGATVDPIIPKKIKRLSMLSNYCVVARIDRQRGQTTWMHTWMHTWNGLEPPALPTKQDFLLCDDPD